MTDFYDLPEGEQEKAIKAAEWLIQQIISEGSRLGITFTDQQIWVLTNSHLEFDDDIRELVRTTHNDCVQIVRALVIRLVNEGTPSMLVRPGLLVPTELELNYELVYLSNLPWFVSSVMQSSFLGNPLAGENKEWTPRNTTPSSKAASGDKSLAFWTLIVLGILVVLAMLIGTIGASNSSRSASSSSSVANTTSSPATSASTSKATPIPSATPLALPAGYSGFNQQFGMQWTPSAEQTCNSSSFQACMQVNIFVREPCTGTIYGTANVKNSSDVIVGKIIGSVKSPKVGEKVQMTLLSSSNPNFPQKWVAYMSDIYCY